MKKLILLIFSLVFSVTSFSQTVNTMDYSFGSGTGIVSFSGINGRAIAKWLDKTLVAGNGTNFVQVRKLKSDGTLDSTFGTNGLAQYLFGTGASVNLTCMTADILNKKIYVAGNIGPVTGGNTGSGFILCFNSDGSINTGFNGTGLQYIDIASIKENINVIGIHSGKVIAAGDSSGKFLVVRINPDGTKDNSFGGGRNTISLDKYGSITAMDINSSGEIVLGSSLTTDDLNGATITKLRSNGYYAAFGTNGTLELPSSLYNEIAGIKFQPDGKIVVGGSINPGNGDYKVLRLLSDGSSDASFYNTSGTYIYANSTYDDRATGLSIDEYGRIVLTGYSSLIGASFYVYHSVVRLSSDGVTDPDISFIIGNAPENPSYGSILSYDDRLMMIGTLPNSPQVMTVAKINMKRFHSLSFDPVTQYIGNDPFILPDYPNISYSTSTPLKIGISGKKVTIRDTGNAVVKVSVPGSMNYYPLAEERSFSIQIPPAVMAGKKIITAGLEENYAVLSNVTGTLSYAWTYTGTGATFLTGNSSQGVTVYFSKNATGGTLTCQVRGALTIDLSKTITVNADYTGSAELDPVQCSEEFASCAGNFIDAFRLNTLYNDTSGCSQGGYADYTASNLTTTLILGSVYTAGVKIDASSNIDRYVAVWLDYDNDGDFTGADEFLGVSFSNETQVKINNIVLKNNEEYAGARRLRVRCLTNAAFSPTESCPQADESGETEDYMVTLKKQDELQGPNVITPNSDGKNDYLVMRGVNPKKTNKIVIVDKLGDLKYSKEDYKNDWDGKDLDGKLLSKGTYYYIFTNGDNSVRGFFEVLY